MNYITSDLHFGHENLCKNLRKMTADECTELLITNWNKQVSKKDKVWILGDVTMEKPKLILEILPLLHGFKHVILGNHDTSPCISALIQCGCKIDVSVKYHNLLFTHYPVHPSELAYCSGNIHGHLHCGERVNLGPLYYNVNCEFHNYTPIPFEEIENYFKNLHKNFAL